MIRRGRSAADMLLAGLQVHRNIWGTFRFVYSLVFPQESREVRQPGSRHPGANPLRQRDPGDQAHNVLDVPNVSMGVTRPCSLKDRRVIIRSVKCRGEGKDNDVPGIGSEGDRKGCAWDVPSGEP